MTAKTKHIPAHRVAIIEAFEEAFKGRSDRAKVKLAKAKALTDKFYSNSK